MGVWMLPPQRPSLDADLNPVGMEMRGKNVRIVIHRTKADGTNETTVCKPLSDDMATTNWENESPAVADEDEEVTPTLPGPGSIPVVGHPRCIPNNMKIQPKCYVCGRASPTTLRREDGSEITCCPQCMEDIGYEFVSFESGELRLKPVT